MTLAPSLRFWVAKVLHLLKLLLLRQSPLPLRLPRQNPHRHLQPNLRLLSNKRLPRLPNLRLNLLPLLRLRRPQLKPQRLLLWRQQPVICCHR